MSLERALKYLADLLGLLESPIFHTFRDAVLLAIEIITFVQLIRTSNPSIFPVLFHGEIKDE